METTQIAERKRFPVIALRGDVIFPGIAKTIDLGRERSVNALKAAQTDGRQVFLIAQRDASKEHPGREELYEIGTVANIRHVVLTPEKTIRVLLEGTITARLAALFENNGYQEATIEPIEDKRAPSVTLEQQAVMEICVKLADDVMEARSGDYYELMQRLRGEKDPFLFCRAIATTVLTNHESRQKVLELVDQNELLAFTMKAMSEEFALGETIERLQEKVQEYIDKANHDYYLREQIHVIREELGENEDEEIVELRARLRKSKMSQEARERVEKELKRLARTSVQAPESAVSQNYIEYMLELPWEVRSKEDTSIKRARKIFDEDHYGLTEVKERLLEYLAVRTVADRLKSPILCLVGPPGVGKTSIAHSVARALKREFAQMSLGGVHDEAEVRGHRKTYVGAMPGRIISAIEHAKVMNPVFLLDEIDKMTHDLRGDPSSALLEALDPAQNNAFRDHYLEAPFDLSDVLFITTANTTSTIDSALLDRMEVIEVPSYTLEEKVQIAKRHLLPKQMDAHGLKKTQLKLSEKTIKAVIDSYTREAGVRTLERTIGKICRKATLKFVENPEQTNIVLKENDLPEYLGAPVYVRQGTEKRPAVGVVNGLAWTQVGGEVMPVEAVCFSGKGNIEITGRLGDVMQESVKLARSVVRKHLKAYGLEESFFELHDLHVHVPEGAVPKDGPSAGVALTCAILSAASGLPADNATAMTGEITLHGKVLPIGGVKEKLLAAYRMGIRRILLPRDNQKDLEKIEKSIRDEFEIILMDNVDDALEIILER